jgi:hypothetical protein
MEREQNGQLAEAEVFPLDDAAIEMIQEYERGIQALLLQENAVLTHFVKQHQLPGHWQLRREGPGAGRELVKQPAQPVSVMMPQ